MVWTTTYGYPRIGEKRELKKATEAYWSGKATEAELLAAARDLRKRHWKEQSDAGIDLVPSGDFSFYDGMLDMALRLGAIPKRFRQEGITGLALLFGMARGTDASPACEMTKWFDTNYHYIVPELDGSFSPDAGDLIEAFREAKSALGLKTKPVLIGPLTFLHLSKISDPGRFRSLFRELGPAYGRLVSALAAEGAEWIQIDEPAVVFDQTSPYWGTMAEVYGEIARGKGDARLLLATYYDDITEAWPTLLDLPVDAIGVDLVRGPRNRDMLIHSVFPSDKTLVAGIVDGRNVWRMDLDAVLDLLEVIGTRVPSDQLALAPSCSLLHLPYSVEQQKELDPQVASWLAFARERLGELRVLKTALNEGREAVSDALADGARRLSDRARSPRTRNDLVRRRMTNMPEEWFHRPAFSERRPRQERRLGLPALPTTTIGSFPQTPEVRSARSRNRAGKLSDGDYRSFIEEKMREVIRLQEEIGLDVLVHGEFERTDMVEYFAERMDGMAVTRDGWVQSYGTRYVRPPIIFGDVSRPDPMTVKELAFAQSLTPRPVKGMLTGPVTILNWSFPRPDLTREEIANQIALALRDETTDLEKAGIGVIQIDEPAFREGLPLKRSEWDEYIRWAVRAFRLSSSGVDPSTQIHSHMCYSDFNELIEPIADLDADVLSVENSRSSGEILEAFKGFSYPQWIGPGIYDVHSERVPSVEEAVRLIQRAGEVLPRENLWVNPDCGLKTRRFEEVVPSLKNMVEAARKVRTAWAAKGRITA